MTIYIDRRGIAKLAGNPVPRSSVVLKDFARKLDRIATHCRREAAICERFEQYDVSLTPPPKWSPPASGNPQRVELPR